MKSIRQYLNKQNNDFRNIFIHCKSAHSYTMAVKNNITADQKRKDFRYLAEDIVRFRADVFKPQAHIKTWQVLNLIFACVCALFSHSGSRISRCSHQHKRHDSDSKPNG